jgi:predicted RecB family endonuclease
LSRALGVGYDGASSSAKEYQDLRKELDIFVKVLMQVVATYEQHEPSSSLNTLDQVTKSVVDECGTLLQEAADRFIPRYHSSLQSGGSGRKIKDAYKKIEWSVREKERLHELRDKLRENTERLCLLTALAAR